MSQKKSLVIITRPECVVDKTVSYFNDAGLTAIASPLIRRVINSEDGVNAYLSQAQDSCVMVFPSVASIDYCFQLMPEFKPSVHSKIVAVGPASKDRWCMNSRLPIHLAQPHNSDGIINYIESIPKPEKIAVITAPDGREAIKNYCEKHKITYLAVHVYQRLFLPLQGHVVATLRDKSNDLILCFTSIGTLKYFYAQIGQELEESVQKIVSTSQLVTASERISKAAKNLGFAHILTADSADDKDMCKAIVKLQEVG